MENTRMEVDEVTERCARMQFEGDEDEDVIEVEEESLRNEVIDLRWALVGRMLIERAEKFDYMKRVFAEAWKPGMGVCFSEMDTNHYLIQFGHEADIRRVVEGGPWSYNNNVLLLERVYPGEDPKLKKINNITLWLQAHEIPMGCMSENIAQMVGKKAGDVVEVDPNNFNGFKKSYMRIKVKMDASKPIKESVSLKLGGKAMRIWFKYERLPTYCYGCGLLGHSEKFCRGAYLNDEGVVIRKWSAELRAIAKSNPKSHVGDKWLRSEPLMIAR